MKNINVDKKVYYEARNINELIKILIDRRVELELTQWDLANRLGLKQSVISRMESSKSSPTLKTLLKITSVLGLEVVLIPDDDKEEEVKND
jgi:transcriptional regulator with XRE-family HTH domain